MSKNIKKNEIRNALDRELKNVQLSDRMKKDILYNAQHSKKPVQKKYTYRYVCAAAAVVVLMCASLLIRGGHVFPDSYVESVPGKNGMPAPAPVAAEGEGAESDEYTPTPMPEQAIGREEFCPTVAPTAEQIEVPVPERTDSYIDAEPTSVPGNMADLFMQFDGYDEVVPAAIGETVWATPNGRFYHLVSDCSGMQNASATTRNEASLAGKQPCPVCIAFVTPTPMPEEALSTPESAYRFYGTENGTFFHTDETCSGMQNARWLSDLSGKSPCPVCIPYVTPTPMPVEVMTTPEPTEVPDVVVCDAPSTPEPAQQIWYGTEEDYLFHRIPDCSGLGIAPQLDDLTGKLPCPYCVTYLSYSDGDVRGAYHHSDYYGTEHGIFYHLEENCSGMENAVSLTNLTNKQPCPSCILGAVFYPMAAPTPEPIQAPGTEAFAIFWGTPQGKYYHVVEDCSGMKNTAWISRLDDRLPCPNCIGDSFWMLPESAYFHLDAHCSGMENAVAADSVEVGNAGKQPCPICMGIEIDADADSNTGTGVNSIIGVNRYTIDDGCIMELEYVADPEFRFINEPDTTNWYVDEVESPEYFFEEYLDHRLPDEYIAQLKNAYEKDGKAGYEVRDTLVMLNGVNTEFSADDRDVPAGHEYRFDDVENPFRECVLYLLDRPYEGNSAEVTVVERLMQWWFDGEKVYRLTKDHTIVDEALPVTIGDDNRVFPIHEKVGFFGLEADAAGYTLGNNHYAIIECGESLDLSASELISVNGDSFNAEMTTDPTFHVNKVVGWRYPAEMADHIASLRLSNGESSVDVDYAAESAISTIAALAELLTNAGVSGENIDSAVSGLIVIGENGDILAMANQPVREELIKAGLTEDEIAANYMVNSVLAILDGDMDYDPIGE